MVIFLSFLTDYLINNRFRVAFAMGGISYLSNLILLQSGSGILSSPVVASLLTAIGALVAAFFMNRREMRKMLERNKKERDQVEIDNTDALLRYISTDREKLDAATQNLRQEEREFMHSQIAAANARADALNKRNGVMQDRSHAISRAYQALELANDGLIALLAAKEIPVPTELYAANTRKIMIEELRKIADEQTW
jgi:hypothetical protein